MKELSTEEKAKRYDEAIERARTEYKNHEAFKGFCEMLVNIFPELAESEDEKIKEALRKRIIRYDPNNEILIKEEGISQKQFLAWLEKQGEQKPVDKVEPKFKYGDWIIFNGLTLYINEVVEGYYRTISKGGIINSYDWGIDNAARLWTLNEAKDGDVLATKDNHICIFDNTVEEGKYPFAYCGLSTYFGFEIYDRTLPFTHDSVYPATREQRDKLEKAMLKAGYKWNTEERKLEKI